MVSPQAVAFRVGPVWQTLLRQLYGLTVSDTALLNRNGFPESILEMRLIFGNKYVWFNPMAAVLSFSIFSVSSIQEVCKKWIPDLFEFELSY